MSHHFADVVFTPAVKAAQDHYGSRVQQTRMQALAGPNDELGEAEAAFLAAADTFQLATVSQTGWPYVQHRGGPRGFVRVLSPTQIAYADFGGNRQYVSAGNVAVNDKVAIIVMDYANRRRLKLLGHLHFTDVADADAGLVAKVALPGYRAKIERVAVIDVVAFDWNCLQHITQRFTLDEVESAARPLRERIAELEVLRA